MRGRRRPPTNQLEQPVVRPDVPAAVDLDGDTGAVRTDAGIDDGEKNGAGRKARAEGGEQIGGGLRIMGRSVDE